MFKRYYYLTKPGIIYGNAVTLIAGFLYAAKGNINLSLLFETLIGTSLIIGSACVINNVLDSNIDKLMSRTEKRATAAGTVSHRNAIIYGIFLGLLGFGCLLIFNNRLVFYIGLVAYFDYIVLYGISKRHSVFGTLVGSISGAASILAGYCAVEVKFNNTALILFLILVVWQMPHFYSIAIFRLKDYRAAKLPVLPVRRGIYETKIQIIFYVVYFIILTGLLGATDHMSYTYRIIMLAVGLIWLFMGIRGFGTHKDKLWARKMFFNSLIVLSVFSILLSIDYWI